MIKVIYHNFFIYLEIYMPIKEILLLLSNSNLFNFYGSVTDALSSYIESSAFTIVYSIIVYRLNQRCRYYAVSSARSATINERAIITITIIFVGWFSISLLPLLLLSPLGLITIITECEKTVLFAPYTYHCLCGGNKRMMNLIRRRCVQGNTWNS